MPLPTVPMINPGKTPLDLTLPHGHTTRRYKVAPGAKVQIPASIAKMAERRGLAPARTRDAVRAAVELLVRQKEDGIDDAGKAKAAATK